MVALISGVLVDPAMIRIERIIGAAGLYRGNNRMSLAQIRRMIAVKLFRDRFFVFSAGPHSDTTANIRALL